ncbi:MAG: hypothetical protein IPI67_39670 [Myxococcales bacterium]|nr:hypothetical protein [Myxococcales bacterium]
MLGLVLGYLAAIVASGTYLRAKTFSLRALEPTRLDTAWQLELSYLADRGAWSGRDFHYARGPLWQALTWLAKGGPLETSPAGVIAAMETSHLLAGIAASLGLTLFFVKGPWARVVTLLALSLMSYAAGISTLRAMLSVAIVVSYLPDADAVPSFRRALAPALLTSVGLLYSFDRAPVAIAAIGIATVTETIARKRRGQSLRPAWLRAAWYFAALAIILAATSAVAAALGAHPLDYVPAQGRIASAYGALWTGWDAGVRPANIVALVLGAGVLGAIPLLARSGRFVEAVWVASVLPAASFATIVTDQGHVFVAIAPLLVVLVLAAARSEADASIAQRSAPALLAFVAFAGWFGAYRTALWLDPSHIVAAIRAFRHGTLDDREYVTDVTPAATWVTAAKERGVLPCVALAPGLTIVHALARVPGPTLLTLRWTEQQQRERARSLESAACPYYVHEVLGFDDARGADWLLGEDFVAIAELYEPKERVAPTTMVLERRALRAVAPRQTLPSPAIEHDFAFDAPGELLIPLGARVRGDALVALDYTIHVARVAQLVGGLPSIEFRFERAGAPVSAYRQLFHAVLGRPVRTLVSPDSVAAQATWLLGERPAGQLEADALRLRFRRQGRLSAAHGKLRVLGLSVITPPPLAPEPPTPACVPKLDLTQELASGHAHPRNVAARLTGRAFELHPNPPPLHLAEIYFDVRPCEDSCLFAELEVRAPPGSGDGVDFEVHVLGQNERPRLLRERVLPGQRLPLEVALWPFAGRESLLRFGTENGADAHNDYAVVSRAEIGRCSARTGIAEALRGQWAKADGSLELKGPDLVLPAEARQLRYPLRISKDTCLSSGLVASEGGATLEAYIVVDEIAHRIDKLHFGPARAKLGPLALFDWVGRDVELVLKVVPDAATSGKIVLENPGVSRCPVAR